MRSEIMTVTPELAEKWLKGTTNGNRPVRANHVKNIAIQIENGEWQLNGESIVIDDNGNVIDGQHRLLAIIRAKSAVQSIVVRGASPDSFKTIDPGIARKGGDVLSLSGYKYAKNLAAAINCIHAYYTSNGFYETPRTVGGSHIQLTKTDYLRLAEEYSGCVESVGYIHNRRNTVGAFRPGAFAAAMHYVFGTENSQARDAFFDAITSGIPHFAPADTTVRLRKAYETSTKVRDMTASAKCRYQTWRSNWDAFKTRYERENRKAASSLRFTTVNGVRFSEQI